MHNPSRPDTGLTDRQQEVWCFLAKHLREEQSGATFRDVGLALGIVSPNGVMCHVQALERKGLLTHGRHRARSLRLAGVRLELIPEDTPAGEVARCLLAGAPPPVLPPLGQGERIKRAAIALVRAIDREGEIPEALAELQHSVHALKGGKR